MRRREFITRRGGAASRRRGGAAQAQQGERARRAARGRESYLLCREAPMISGSPNDSQSRRSELRQISA
jgi:hypothetical protein